MLSINNKQDHTYDSVEALSPGVAVRKSVAGQTRAPLSGLSLVHSMVVSASDK